MNVIMPMKPNRTFQITHIEYLKSLQNMPLATFRARVFAYRIDFFIVGILIISSIRMVRQFMTV